MTDRVRSPPHARQRGGQVEVGVGVIGLDGQRATIVLDRLLHRTHVLVQRPEIVGRLGTLGILRERRRVGLARFLVLAHPVQQQPEIVPGCRIGGIDGDHAPVRRDGVLPLPGVGVPLAGPLEPDLGLLRRRLERPHEAGGQRRLRRPGEIDRIEGEHRLARARIEADTIGLREQSATIHEQPHFRQRVLYSGILLADRGERVADLADGCAGVEQRACRTQGQEVPERIAGILTQQIETTQLSHALGRQRQDARQLAQAVDPLGARPVHQLTRRRRQSAQENEVWRRQSAQRGASVAKVADTGEHHGHLVLVGGRDHVLIAQ